MRIALLQTAGDPAGSPDANLDRLAASATRASAGGADLLLAPEMFLTGYAIGSEAARARAEAVDGSAARRIAEIARLNAIAIAYGYPEKGADGHIFNAATLIDSEGHQRLHYRKTHLFADLDRAMFSPGDALSGTAEIGGLNVGLMICYDVEFPENVRGLALDGADLILVPTANMRPHEIVSQLVVPARAYENSVFIAYANRCGSEADLLYCGLSCVAAPSGRLMALAGEDEELLFAELNPEELARARKKNSYIADRRPELYGSLADPFLTAMP